MDIYAVTAAAPRFVNLCGRERETRCGVNVFDAVGQPTCTSAPFLERRKIALGSKAEKNQVGCCRFLFKLSLCIVSEAPGKRKELLEALRARHRRKFSFFRATKDNGVLHPHNGTRTLWLEPFRSAFGDQ